MTSEKQLERTAPSTDDSKDGHTAKLHADAYGGNDGIAPAKDAPSKPQESWMGRAYDWASGAADVGAQVVVGAASKAYDAVKDHPLDTAVTLGEGAVVGVALMAAAPAVGALGFSAAVVAGVGAVAELAMTGLAAEGVASVVKDGVTASMDAAKSADVLMHKSEHGQAEIDAARQDVQTKTGGAALEAVGASTMALGLIGSAMKTGSRIAAIFKGGAEASSDTKSGAAVLPELTLTGTEDPVMAMSKPRKAGKTGTLERDKPNSEREQSPEKSDGFTIPSKAAVLDFKDRVAKYVGERNEKFDARDALLRQANLEDKLDLSIGRGKESQKIQAQLKKTSEPLAKELDLRREAFAKIFNEEKEKLFPGQVVPKIKIESLEKGFSGSAAYGRGKIYLSDKELAHGDAFEQSLFGDNRTEMFLHEAKHAEQDGLKVRSTIDTVTGGDTSGRELTKTELAEVAKRRYGTTNEDLEAMIADINQQRAGRPLTDVEKERVVNLEKSSVEQLLAKGDIVRLKRLERLDKTYKETFPSEDEENDSDEHFMHRITPTPAVCLLDDDTFYTTFEEPSLQLQALKLEYDELPKDEHGHPEYYEEFEEQARPVVKEALEKEIATGKHEADLHYDAYRHWLHEQEAWAVSEAVKKYIADQQKPLFDFLN